MAVHYRTCPFCEATCGLRVETEGDEVVSIRGDEEDVLSHGFICPKAYELKELHEDPDRLTAPLIRRDGELVEGTVEEAFEEIDRRLPPILEQHGRQRRRRLPGQPERPQPLDDDLRPGLAARARLPEHLLGEHGRPDAQAGVGRADVRLILSIPVPDVDRSDHLLILGANPLIVERQPPHRARHARAHPPSPQARRQGRGGRPRRGRTAEAADEHHFIPPGRAPPCWGSPPRWWRRNSTRRARSPSTATASTSSQAGARVRRRGGAGVGIEPEEIRRMARECRRGARDLPHRHDDQEFGTLASWLVDMLNVLTGNLDREGGDIPPGAAAQKNASGSPAWARASGWGAGTAACAGFPRPTASCPWPAWPRRSIRRARARSGR